MSKITAVIDIGSNSARMAIFERTSRFGFHLVKEIKSRVRISEDTYKNDGYLQPVPMERAFNALREFLVLAKQLKARKILCVATSATRDAPNRLDFINRVKRELKLNIKVIDGEKEALFGAVSALNLLDIKNAITIDVGGGSTECAIIKDGKIEKLISLKLGTIRLKELFFDKKASIDEIKEFINQELKRLSDDFKSDCVVGIGGTVRAISKSFMKTYKYPLNSIHGFEYDLEKERDRIEKIIKSETSDLCDLNIKKDRVDTIREGALIFSMLTDMFEAKRVITAGAGVREGVFLNDLLRNSNRKFPENFNLSVNSLLDRFVRSEYQRVSNHNQKLALELFDKLKPLHNLDESFKKHIRYAIKLVRVGNRLSFYNASRDSSYFILSNLTYGFSHRDRVLISTLIKFAEKKLPKESDIREFKDILPQVESIRWLSFIIILAESINADLSNKKVEFEIVDKAISIKSKASLYLAKESIKVIEKPASIVVDFKDLG